MEIKKTYKLDLYREAIIANHNLLKAEVNKLLKEIFTEHSEISLYIGGDHEYDSGQMYFEYNSQPEYLTVNDEEIYLPDFPKYQEIVDEIMEILDYLSYEEVYEEFGYNITLNKSIYEN